MNGGAALSRSSQEFLNTTLATALQGYGATESSGMACISLDRENFYSVSRVPEAIQ
jgi:long-subunit acyl-CoA synthetase (AMP-forming)